MHGRHNLRYHRELGGEIGLSLSSCIVLIVPVLSIYHAMRALTVAESDVYLMWHQREQQTFQTTRQSHGMGCGERERDIVDTRVPSVCRDFRYVLTYMCECVASGMSAGRARFIAKGTYDRQIRGVSRRVACMGRGCRLVQARSRDASRP